MPRGRGSFTRSFTCSAVLRIPLRVLIFSPTGLSPYIAALSRDIRLKPDFFTLLMRSYNPAVQARRFGLFRFRSPLLSEYLLISFPPVTEMFHFTGLSSLTYFEFQLRISYITIGRVSPFGNRRIKGCLHLPDAYRSLPRPSSASSAKASTVRPLLLDHIIWSHKHQLRSYVHMFSCSHV